MTVFPDVITIKIVNSDTNESIPRIVVRIQLYANQKNDYYFILPVSDKNGRITVTKEWLRNEIQLASRLFPMDFASSLETVYPKFELEIMDKNSVVMVVKGMSSYRDYTYRTSEYVNSIATSENLKYFPTTKLFDINNENEIDIEITTHEMK